MSRIRGASHALAGLSTHPESVRLDHRKLVDGGLPVAREQSGRADR